MSETTITVSNGEDFFRIPLSDLGEAAADGFYVPATQDLTIVSDGATLYEIPVEDLKEAQGDGFRDVLTKERGLAFLAERLIAVAGAGQAAVPLDPTLVDESLLKQQREPTEEPVTPNSKLGGPGADGAPRGKKGGHKADGALVSGTMDIEAEEPENDGSAVSRFLLPGGAIGGARTWSVMAINAGLHGVAVLILALIVLPLPETEIFMEITSAIEPPEPIEQEFEEIQVDQPDSLEDDPVEAQVVNPIEEISENPLEIDINDLEINIPDVEVETEDNAGPPSSKNTGEMSGRSKAGRAALVAKRGGNAASEAAVQAGLKWLANHQYPDGGWSYDHAQGACNGQCGQAGSLSTDCRNAATGMALLAMMGAGHTPYDGKYSENVRAGIQFLLKNSAAVPAGRDMRGKVAGNTGMYTQAIAATALCEAVAMAQHNSVLARSEKEFRKSERARQQFLRSVMPAANGGVQFIVQAQHQQSGGWGYNPRTAGDTSILGWQIMALKAAVHAKIPFPANSVAGANRFLTGVQHESGHFGYRGPEKKLSTTAIGVIARMLSGMPRDNPFLQKCVAHLSAAGPNKANMYYNYYATQVMLHYGGEEWNKWNAVMRDHLVNTQAKEGHAAGSWGLPPGEAHGARGGRLYMTCLCTMTLEVYYRHLPLYGEPEDNDTKSDKPGKSTAGDSAE